MTFEEYLDQYRDELHHGVYLECVADVLGDGYLFGIRRADERGDNPEGCHDRVEIRAILKNADFQRLSDYSDGFEANTFLKESAIAQQVDYCSCDWTTEQCKELDGCCLCGEIH